MSTSKRANSNLDTFMDSFNDEVNSKILDKVNSNFIKSQEILFNQKTFYEILLDLVKKTQLNYLNKTKPGTNNFNKKQNNIQIKEIITNLKEDLTSVLKEKQLNLNYMQKINSEKKAELQNLLFPSNECKRRQNFLGCETILSENDEKCEESEINQIKNMNFRIENEILSINYYICKKKYIIEYLKNFDLVIEDYKEIICDNSKDKKKVTKILHKALKEIRQCFIEKVFQKTQNDLLIDDLESKIKLLNEGDDEKNNINSSLGVIQEESKEFTESIILNSNKNLFFINSKKPSINNNDSRFKLQLDNEQQMNINDIKNYLINMNINVNINVNDINKQNVENTFNLRKISKKDKENDDDKKNKKFGFYLNDSKQKILNLKKGNTGENENEIGPKQDNERKVISVVC